LTSCDPLRPIENCAFIYYNYCVQNIVQGILDFKMVVDAVGHEHAHQPLDLVTKSIEI
jgi:hypothetical protein